MLTFMKADFICNFKHRWEQDPRVDRSMLKEGINVVINAGLKEFPYLKDVDISTKHGLAIAYMYSPK